MHPEVLAPFDQRRAAREAAEKHEYQQCISAQVRVRGNMKPDTQRSEDDAFSLSFYPHLDTFWPEKVGP